MFVFLAGETLVVLSSVQVSELQSTELLVHSQDVMVQLCGEQQIL